MAKWMLVRKLSIPEGFAVTVSDGLISIEKDSKKADRNYKTNTLKVEKKDNDILFYIGKDNRRCKAYAGSIESHLKNTFNGIAEPYTYKLKVHYKHFPMKAKVEGNKVIIDNFIGAKKANVAKILPGVEVKIKGQDIEVTGYDKEATGQTAANMEQATRQTWLCTRSFMDSIYISYKP